MLNYVIILLLGYATASFILTALFVRLGKKTALSAKDPRELLSITCHACRSADRGFL